MATYSVYDPDDPYGLWKAAGANSQQNFNNQTNAMSLPSTVPSYSNIGGFTVATNPLTTLPSSSGGGGLSASRMLSGGGSRSPGFGFNLPTFEMAGNVMGGIGSLAKGWAAMKGLGLAEDELEFKRGAFERNFAQQKQAYDDTVRQYNNAQAERQAFVNATHANPSLSDIRTLELA